MEKNYTYIHKIFIILLSLWLGIQIESLGGNNKVENDSLAVQRDTSTLNNLNCRSIASPLKIDLAEVKARGKLRALTGFGSTSYFIYRGTPMGFEYDLLKLLAKDLGVDLEIIAVNSIEEVITKLNEGEGDIIADNLVVTKSRENLVDFTLPISLTRQVLIQRKPTNWKALAPVQLEKKLIRNPMDLMDQTVHVRRGSVFHLRLLNLSEEIGGEINIIEEPEFLDDEELISKVASGEIPYTVVDENIAQINKAYYPDIDISTPISFSQRIAWAVRENSPELKEAVNNWIRKVKREATFNVIHHKYFSYNKRTDHVLNCTKYSSCSKKISPYDSLIIKHAKDLDWDWRLLASLIYQESRFNPKAKSHMGASGLMQLMPATGYSFGARNLSDPEQSLKAGVSYIKWLNKYWENKVPDKSERIKFIMASYNVGQEHIADAQRLAEKYKKDPQKWDDNVAFYILQKSKPKYCSDPVVKYGYCRGIEPFKYVNEVFDRYEHYKNLIEEDI